MSVPERIGIMGAMPEEIEGIVALLSNPVQEQIGMRTYYSGTINGVATVVVFSRWGKVAAAATVSTLIHHFGITQLVFTGVAGAIGADLKVGDIVLAERLVQHDMDARPLMPQYEIPLLGHTYFETDEGLSARAKQAIERLIADRTLHTVFADDVLGQFNIAHPQLFVGDIASGDKFFANTEQKLTLHAGLPSVLCVEMEGAAVAQVCYEYSLPFIVIRTISDVADDQSHIDFPLFIRHISSKYATEIIRNMYW